jgi:hypothetical protein
LSQFVDRVERGLLRQREKDLQAEEERQRIAAAEIPESAFEMPLEDLGISLRFATILAGAGYTTVGDLMLQMHLDPDVILRLEGIGAKAIEEVETALAKFESVQLVAAEEPVIEEMVAPQVEVVEPVTEELLEVAVEAIPEEPIITEVEAEPVVAAIEVPVVEAGEVVASVVTAEETVAEPVAVEMAAGEPVSGAEEEPTTFDELFEWRGEAVEIVATGDEDDEEEIDKSTHKKKKKKKKRFVELEYDPDKDVTVVRKKRKRSDVGDWGGEW